MLLLVLATACGSGMEHDPPEEPHNNNTSSMDASVPTNNDAATTEPTIELEIGTGETQFQTIQDGEEIPLVSAPQGGGGAGSHFWLALQERGLDPHGIEIHETIKRITDGETVSDITRHEELQMEGEKGTLVGFRAVVSDCYVVVGHELEFTVEVRDAADKTATDTLRFKGPELCPRGNCEGCDL